MRRGTVLVVVAVLLIALGLIATAISFSQVPRDAPLVNSIVRVDETRPYTSFAVSARYFLSGNSNGKINGTLLAVNECCVDFYIFTDTAWNNWVANNETATNSSNSPVLTVNSSAIDAKNGVSTSFSFAPDPSKIYELVFFNENRSLWSTNTTAAFHVVADIYLNYSQSQAKALVYPGVALIVVGAVLILFRYRFLKEP